MAANLEKFGDLVEDFAKDTKKENEGVWMTYKRFQYLVSRSHRDNVKFAKLMEEKMRPYQWAVDRGNLAAIKDVANDVMQEVYAEAILKAIRKIPVDGVAQPNLEYSTEDGVALFKKLPDLWDAVFKFSGADDNYSPDAIKADSGN